MNHKEIIKKVEDLLRSGATKEEIFNELGGTDDIARTIAATPYHENRIKYKKLNNLLAFIVFYYVVTRICISAFNIIAAGIPLYLFPLTLFIPICATAFGIGILKFRGTYYYPTGLLGISLFLQSFTQEIEHFNTVFWMIWSAVNIPLLIAVYLSFTLKNRLCPNLGFLGAKTNKSGNYLFLNEAG